MKEIPSTVTRKGQVTIPAEVRRYLNLRTPDRVTFVIDEATGTVRLEAPRPVDLSSLRGAAGSLDRPMSWDEMRRIAYEDRFAESEVVGE